MKYIIGSVIFILQLLKSANCGVLIWGSESIRLPSLKHFNDEDFDLLKSYMRRPKVLIFRGDPMTISGELQNLLQNKYTAYVPSSKLNIPEAIDLNEDPASNFKLIEDTLSNCSREYDNILALIVSDVEPAGRQKRAAAEVDESVSSTTEISEVVTESSGTYEPTTGPVLYQAATKASEFAMIYSSRTPTLKINSSTYNLGKAAIQTVDDREKYRVLSVGIPVDSIDKVTLRFKFLWYGGYWSLNTIILSDMYGKTFTLTRSARGEISASRNFSYHCIGNSVFENSENGVELWLFDVQAQPDAREVRFGDVFDCITFTTAPIWSGIFVVFLLLIGLVFGLGALNSIKTMDKFDNNKTKQLTITANE